MDLLPKQLFRLIRPFNIRKNVSKWHLLKLERNTNLFSVAIPVALVSGVLIGLGVLLIDKQREMAYYRHASVGTRTFKLEQEHDQLTAFMKQTQVVPKEQVVSVPIPQSSIK